LIQFLQFSQSHQLHTTNHLSISAIFLRRPHTRPSFSFDRNFTSIFPFNRAPRARMFFRALFTLFSGRHTRGPFPRSRARSFPSFWLPLHAQHPLAALLFFDFSLF